MGELLEDASARTDMIPKDEEPTLGLIRLFSRIAAELSKCYQ